MNRIVTIRNFIWILVKVIIQIILNLFLFIIEVADWILFQNKNFVLWVLKFLGPVSNAVYGKLNQAELFRVVATASAAGTGASALITALKENADKLSTDPVINSFVRAMINGLEHNYFVVCFALAVFIGDILRRVFHK